MNIDPWEVTDFVENFAKVPDYDALMWLEDKGCYNAITGNNCELLLGIAKVVVNYDIPEKVASKLHREFWYWAKSAALEALEKQLLENENADI
jgi:hypothetical protein